MLFYDIETTPLKAYVWGLGKQVVRHGQLDSKFSNYNIICITYCFNDKKPAKALVWNKKTHSCDKMIEEFDKIVNSVDISIGKNSDRFDVKHINTQRWLHGLNPFPEWAFSTDDLEKQLRKYFYLPSYSLDAISQLKGLGGKDKMEFQDWIDIVERQDPDDKKLNKMVKYGKKDVVDTRELYNSIAPYIIPKFNMARKLDLKLACIHCGSTKLKFNGTRIRGQSKYQFFYCNEHGGYAGKASIGVGGKLGRIS